MKALKLVACLLIVMLLSACAAQNAKEQVGYDQAYINAVEHGARRHGTLILWANPPKLSVAVAQAENDES